MQGTPDTVRQDTGNGKRQGKFIKEYRECFERRMFIQNLQAGIRSDSFEEALLQGR